MPRDAKEDAAVRETATYSLGQVVRGTRVGVDVLNLLCQLATTNVDDRIKRSAVVALGNCGVDNPDVRMALDKAMGDPMAAVRQNAVWALGEICKKTEIAPVTTLHKALTDQADDKLVKRDAALALGKILSNHDTSGNDDARRREQEHIAKVAGQVRDVMDDLLLCAGHPYVELRKAACQAMVNLVGPEDAKAKAALAKACKDEDFEVRCNAAMALANVGGEGSEAAVPVLREVLQKGDASMRRLAVLQFRHLGTVAGAALPDLLRALAEDKDEVVRFNAAVSMETWKAEAAIVVPALVGRVLDSKEDIKVRVAAATSLKGIGACPEAADAIPGLAGTLADSTQPPMVRERVLWALMANPNELGKHEEVFTAMTKVLTDKELRKQGQPTKMLRFTCAYLFGQYKKAAVPDEVFPVLQEFLDDTSIVIYQGRDAAGGSVTEGGSGKTEVREKGKGDGRIMAIQALKEIGRPRLMSHASGARITEQLLGLRTATDIQVSDKAIELLKAWKVN